MAWSTFLVFATVVSFFADATAILKGRRRAGLVLLVTFGVLSLALVSTTRQNERIRTENSALKDVQARAATLLKEWSNGDDAYGFSPELNSPGENEGIATAAADLLEDGSACRPGAYQIARERLDHARTKSDAVARFDDVDQYDIWNDAASAAVRQIAGIARVSPTCVRDRHQ